MWREGEGRDIKVEASLRRVRRFELMGVRQIRTHVFGVATYLFTFQKWFRSKQLRTKSWHSFSVWRSGSTRAFWAGVPGIDPQSPRMCKISGMTIVSWRNIFLHNVWFIYIVIHAPPGQGSGFTSEARGWGFHFFTILSNNRRYGIFQRNRGLFLCKNQNRV